MAVMGSKNILALIFSFVALIVLIRTIVSLWNSYLADFSIFYQAVFVGFSLQNPYTYKDFFAPYIYPPVFLLLMYPFSFLSFQMAANSWLILSVIFFVVSLFLLRSLLNASLLSVSIVFLLSVLSFPLKFTLGMGQVNSMLLFSICMFLFFFKKNTFVSSVFFYIAIVIKIIPVLFLYPLLLKREYFAMLFLVMIFLVGGLISIVLFEDNVTTYYVLHILPSVITGGIKHAYYNQSLLGTLSRFSGELFALPIQLIIGSFSCVVLWLKRPSLISSISFLITMTLLISSFAWQHHLMLLIIPFFYALTKLKKSYHYLMLFIAYLLIAVNIKHPESFQHVFLSPLLLSHASWGILLLYIMLCYILIKAKHEA